MTDPVEQRAPMGGAGGDRRPHLLFLGHGAERTGPPILLGHLLQGLAAAGATRHSVVTARRGPLLATYRATGADARGVADGREPLAPLAAGLRRAGLGSAVGPLQQRARARALPDPASVDLVYVNAATPPTAALLRALAPPAGTPVIVHVHELDVGLRLTLDDADRRFLLDRADHLLAASAPVAELLVHGHGVARSSVTTCAEFVDVAAVSPWPAARARQDVGIPPDALVVGSVGLPDWRKDPERLLHAVRLVRATRPALDPWVLWIGGDPSSDDGRRLDDEARRLGLRERFVHVAHRDRPDHLLGALDVFALPAREDAFPLAALEAAAAGLPLVCFRAGGVAGLADLGAGIAVAYGDVPAFADALRSLLEDPSRRAALGARAAALVADDHDVAVGVARIGAVIDRWTGPRADG